MVAKDALQRTHGVVEVAIDDLRPDPANRRISPAQLEALTRGIREFGLVQPIISRLEDKTVIGGRQRLRRGNSVAPLSRTQRCPSPSLI